MHSKDSSASIENRLLADLPRDEYCRLLPNSQVIRLPRNRILYETGDEVRSAYFLNHGLVSLLAITEDGQTVDICTIGNDGVVGLPIVLNVSIMPCRVVTQLPCEALMIKSHHSWRSSTPGERYKGYCSGMRTPSKHKSFNRRSAIRYIPSESDFVVGC